MLNNYLNYNVFSLRFSTLGDKSRQEEQLPKRIQTSKWHVLERYWVVLVRSVSCEKWLCIRDIKHSKMKCFGLVPSQFTNQSYGLGLETRSFYWVGRCSGNDRDWYSGDIGFESGPDYRLPQLKFSSVSRDEQLKTGFNRVIFEMFYVYYEIAWFWQNVT
jgi:hypothetical protein